MLQQGGIVLFPCDTVWGILSAQLSCNAIERINALKQRPLDQPVAVLQSIYSVEAKLVFGLVSSSRRLRSYFPSLLTLILPLDCLHQQQSKYRSVASARGEVGIRIVERKHPTESLILATDSLLATSANLHEAPTPLALEQVESNIRMGVDYIAQIETPMSQFASAVYNVNSRTLVRSLPAVSSDQVQAEENFSSAIRSLK